MDTQLKFSLNPQLIVWVRSVSMLLVIQKKLPRTAFMILCMERSKRKKILKTFVNLVIAK